MRLYSARDTTISQDRCLPVCVHDIVAGSPRKRFHGYGTAAHVTDTSRAAFHRRLPQPILRQRWSPGEGLLHPSAPVPSLLHVTGKRNVDHDLSLSVVAELPSLHRCTSFACEYDHGVDARALFKHIHRNCVGLNRPYFDLWWLECYFRDKKRGKLGLQLCKSYIYRKFFFL